MIDRLLAAVLLVLATPLMIVVGLAILWSDGYPIFFRQTRVGKNGRTFRIWKFRTMCNNAERSSGAVWSHSADPRVTELGGWLRCTHLDELPQLFNVLTGDMNLIGPRPERPEFVHELALELPFYTQRLTARPGITGLAQLRLDYDQSLAQVHTKVMLDLEYIRSTSLLRDAALLTCTLPHIVNKLRKKCRDSITSQDEQAASRDTASHSTGISPADLARATGRLHVPHLRAHFSNKFASQEIKPGPALRIKPSMTSSADV